VADVKLEGLTVHLDCDWELLDIADKDVAISLD